MVRRRRGARLRGFRKTTLYHGEGRPEPDATRRGSICFGLVLGAVGFGQISGAPRLVLFDINGFLQGIGFLVLAIGIYDIGEMLRTIEQARGEVKTTTPKMTLKGMAADTKEAVSKGWKGTAIGSFLGFFVGVLPAAGGTPGSLMSYGVAKMISRRPRESGKGNPDGVAAPEAANNSASTGSILPMLTLGIPGSPTTAILLGGMVIWGLVPGRASSSTRPSSSGA